MRPAYHAAAAVYNRSADPQALRLLPKTKIFANHATHEKRRELNRTGAHSHPLIYYYPRSLYICRSTHMAETAKSYELTFEERPGYLFVKVKAERLEYYPAQGCLLEIAREMRGLRQTRLMIYRDVPSVMPRGQVFFISVKMAETFKDVKVVLVNPYPELDEDLNFAALLFHRRTSSG